MVSETELETVGCNTKDVEIYTHTANHIARILCIIWLTSPGMSSLWQAWWWLPRVEWEDLGTDHPQEECCWWLCMWTHCTL